MTESKNYYLLTTTDNEKYDGGKVRAHEIATSRLSVGQWPIYRGTGHKKFLKLGDVCLFYIGGNGPSKHSVIASGEIKNISHKTRGWIEPIQDIMSDLPDVILNLESVKFYHPPRNIQTLRFKLGFIGDKRFWGVYIQGGCRPCHAETSRY